MDRTGILCRRYAPVVLLLLLIAGLAAWRLASGIAPPEGTPPLTVTAAAVLLAIGFAAGIFSGLVGVGGAAILLPIMYFYLGFPESVAIGTGLFVVIFTSISGAWGHRVRNNLDTRVTVWLGAGGVAGVLLGSWLFLLLVDRSALLSLILGLVFLGPTLNMIREGLRPGRSTRAEERRIDGPSWAHFSFGVLVGVLTGLTGLGGGYAIVPGLIYLFGAPVYITMGTSLASLVPMAVIGGGIKVAQGFVAIGAGLILSAGSIVGAQVGAATIRRFAPATLKLVFGVYFLYAAILFIAEYFGVALP